MTARACRSQRFVPTADEFDRGLARVRRLRATLVALGGAIVLVAARRQLRVCRVGLFAVLRSRGRSSNSAYL